MPAQRIQPLTEPSAEAWSLAEQLWQLTPVLLWEASVKLLPGQALTRRFMLSFPAPSAPPAVAALRRLLAGLGLPAAFARDLEGWRGDACTLHFGVEGAGARTLHKLYLELPKPQAPAQATSGRLVHRAYKWDPQQPARRSIAHYRDSSAAGHAALAARIDALVDDPSDTAALLRRTAHSLIERAAQRLPVAELMLLAVAEAGNPRRSFDLGLYDAELAIGALREPLLQLTAGFELPAGAAEGLLEALADTPLGHFAGGIARDGRPFCTLFYGGGRLVPSPEVHGARSVHA